MMIDTHKQAGFTLVELAVAILIIGLLIVAVLKGQELVGNAQAIATINQVNEIESASAIFQSKYRALAGDILNPASTLANCTTEPCILTGNGDGFIDVSSDLIDNLVWSTAGNESRNFWVHLSSAGMLRNIQDGYQGTPNRFGVDFPKTPLGGGWLIQSFRDGGQRRTYLTIVKSITALSDAESRLLTPARAFQIDMKMDDGLADRGRVRGYFAATEGECTEVGAGEGPRNTYLMQDTESPACNLIFIQSRSMVQ